MYCPHCMKKIPDASQTCPYCNQITHSPLAGMATLRVSCRPNVPTWALILQPLTFFVGYKVHITVDGQNYVLNSKKKQIDIPVSVGTHQVRVSAVGKKTAKFMKGVGSAMVFTGAVTGSGSSIIAGAVVEDLGEALSNEGAPFTFGANELKALSVKAAWNGEIVEDK